MRLQYCALAMIAVLVLVIGCNDSPNGSSRDEEVSAISEVPAISESNEPLPFDPPPPEPPPAVLVHADLIGTYRLVDFVVQNAFGTSTTPLTFPSFSGVLIIGETQNEKRSGVGANRGTQNTRYILLDQETFLEEILGDSSTTNCDPLPALTFSLVDDIFTTMLSVEESMRCFGSGLEILVWERQE